MTTLVRFREPLRNVTMNGEFEQLIKTIYESPTRTAALSNHAWTPPLDVWETEGELVYAFDLPGIPEETIAVDLEENTLTVSGSRERSGEGAVAGPFANGGPEAQAKNPEQSKPRRLPVMTTGEGGSTD